MSQLIEQLCGKFPDNFVKQDVGNDPDYVFINDQSYPSTQLWDADNNTVFVNSFEECFHYVEGGWSYNPSIFNEQTLQLYVLTGFTLILLSSFVFRKFLK